MHYNQIQFIGYEIYTGPQSQGNKKIYLGFANIQKDIEERISLLRIALEHAWNNSSQAKTNTVLKIFVVPEFYFRGPNGAYEMDQVQSIISQLQELVSGYGEDWLFIFGTILGVSYPAEVDTLKNKPTGKIDQKAQREVYNFAFVQKGGYCYPYQKIKEYEDMINRKTLVSEDSEKEIVAWLLEEAKKNIRKIAVKKADIDEELEQCKELIDNLSRYGNNDFQDEIIIDYVKKYKNETNNFIAEKAVIIQKEYRSDINFIKAINSYRPNAHNWEQTRHIDERTSEDKKYRYDGLSVFDFDGISFGLEICLDVRIQVSNLGSSDGRDG